MVKLESSPVDGPVVVTGAVIKVVALRGQHAQVLDVPPSQILTVNGKLLHVIAVLIITPTRPVSNAQETMGHSGLYG